MDNIVPVINAISSLIIVLVFAYIVVCAGIDKLQRNKYLSMSERARNAHVKFCEEFSYNSNKPISANTARVILQDLASGHEPHMAYLRSVDGVFNNVDS